MWHNKKVQTVGMGLWMEVKGNYKIIFWLFLFLGVYVVLAFKKIIFIKIDLLLINIEKNEI